MNQTDPGTQNALESDTFNLRRYFSVFSISIILSLTVAMSAVVYLNQKTALVEYSRERSQEFAEELYRQISTTFKAKNMKVSDFLQSKDKESYLKAISQVAEQHIRTYRDIIKLKIFNRQGVTVFSSDEENIGSVNESSYLKRALEGELTSVIIKRATPMLTDTTEKGRIYKIDLLEIYVPIFGLSKTTGRSEVIGAFEIYKNETSLFELMKREFIKVPLLLFFSMMVLYLLLQIVIRKADRTIKLQHDEINQHNRELNEAQKNISESIDEVIKHESFHVRHSNENLLKCWEVKKCAQVDCPCYEADNLRCWQVAGTFCGGRVQGVFAKKYGDCRHCEVYGHAFNNRINMIGESFNNMMTLLHSKHLELQDVNRKLNILVDIDPLTETGNRRSFQKRIESIHQLALRYAHPYSIIICDVDNFKFYNDTYGHQKGDYVLIAMARTMRQAIRRTDELFRWGGEEFIVILPEQSHADALKVAENLRSKVELLNIVHTKSDLGVVTLSCGVSSFSPSNSGGIGWEYVVKQADDALYRAKNDRKNCVYSAPDA